jgi:putative ABC transport system permease protein
VRLFEWFILRRLLAEPIRGALSVSGIALGVAVVLAIQIANQSALGGFRAALDTMAGKTSLEIVGAGVGVDERALAGLAWLGDWGEVSPVIEGEAMALRDDGRAEAVRVLGIDILKDQPFREYRMLQTATGATELRPVQLLTLLVEPDAAIITEAFARRRGLAIGGRLDLAIGDAVRRFTIRGILRNDGPAKVMDGNFVLLDIATAQLAFDRLGRVDRVDVRLKNPEALDRAERSIGARLPPGLAVQRPARRGAQVEKMLAAFQFNLGALSLVALLVGLFLIYNTVATSVISRREEIGILRALGTSRAALLGMFLGEAGALSVIGCAVGVPLGWLLAWGAVGLTSTTVTTLYVAEAAQVPWLAWWHPVVAFMLGVPLALAAAAAPAIEASRISPLESIRSWQPMAASGRRRLPSQLASALCFAGALGLARLPPVNGLPVFGFIAALAIVFGLAFLVPSVLFLLGRYGRRAARLLGIESQLAHANLTGAIPRLSVSVAALAVSLAMLVAIAVMIGSFRETVIYWVNQTLQADLYVSTARRSSLDAQATISPALEAAIRTDPDVAAVDRFRSVTLPYRERLIVAGAGDFEVLLSHSTLAFKAPRDGPRAMREAIGRDAVLVSEAFALRFGVGVGDSVPLPTPHGTRRFVVQAIYYDYSTDRGVVVMDRATFARHFGDLAPTSLTIYLKAGADADTVRERLLNELGTTHRAFIHTNRSLRAEVLRIFDATFAITYGLEAIAILVAILGVTGTLMTLMIERRRELSLLRLVGADLGQITRMIVIESGFLGLVGQALGLVTGFALALVLIYVVNVQSFGWTIQFHVPLAFLAQSSALVIVSTTLAGLYPARFAARLRPVEEVAIE